MKLAAFNVMLTGARETIEKHEAGEAVDAMRLEWARNLIASNPRPKDARKRPVQEPILEMFRADPMCYITRAAVLEAFPAMQGWKADQHIKTMVDNGSLHPLNAGFRKRYFLSREAVQAGAVQIEAEKAAAVDQKKARRVARDQAKAEKTEKKKKPEPKNITYSKKAAGREEKPRSRSDEAIIPPGLIVQVCPGYVDRRFLVEGPIVGGFLSEFHQLRGVKE
jgi:hypothetical protein